MKVQTTVLIDQLFIDNKPYNLGSRDTAELEFSAIDTGGGFHDPLLDISFNLKLNDFQNLQNGKQEIVIHVSDINHEDNGIKVEYLGMINKLDDISVEGSGRLKGEQVSKKIVAFVMGNFR